MKTRMIVENEFGVKTVVWFGSIGVKNELDENDIPTGKVVGIFVKEDKSSYEGGKEGIAYSLTQRLSVIKGELWYNIKQGIPLFDKQRSKGIIDSYVIQTVLKHEEVLSIVEFNSYVINNHQYKCFLKCSTMYGEININI